MRTADGGWALKKKKTRKKKIARMLILLNFLVNCHLLRNASFGLCADFMSWEENDTFTNLTQGNLWTS